MSHTPSPRIGSPSTSRPSTPVQQGRSPSRSSYTDRKPVPSLNRPPTDIRPTTPDSRYPPLSRLVYKSPTPLREQISRPYPLVGDHSRTASISTTSQAINTAIPATPPQTFNAYSTPPASYHGKLNEVVELRNLSPSPSPSKSKKESPFHDRHSVTTGNEMRGSPYSQQRGMPGYLFSGMGQDRGDEREELSFGGDLEEPTFISEKRRSLYPTHSIVIPISTMQDHPDLYPDTPTPLALTPLPSALPAIRARFRLLLSLSNRKDFLLILLPATVLSIAASLTPPYMSSVIGDAFEIFALYPLVTVNATQAQRDALNSGIREKSTLLAAAGLYAVVINYAKTVMWQWHGEMIAGKLRQKVFEGVQTKRMEWFDLGMGLREDDTIDGETIGAGGLMAKFTK